MEAAVVDADHEIATPYASLQAIDIAYDGDVPTFSYRDRYAFTLAKDGSVTFTRPAVPDWLVCIVKDEVFPFEACAVWYPGSVPASAQAR